MVTARGSTHRSTQPLQSRRPSKSTGSRRVPSLRTAASSAATDKKTAATTSPVSIVQPPKPQPPTLPNELLFIIFDQLDTPDLCTIRVVSHRLCKVANVLLSGRIKEELSDLSEIKKEADTIYKDTESEKRPHLRHYRHWLRNSSSHDIKEATWYPNPPAELKTVCECLCILQRAPKIRSPSSSPSGVIDLDPTPPEWLNTRLSWSLIKKELSSYSFKTWLTHLHTAVDHIPYYAIQRVEKIVVSDSTITYDRLREVSTTGYNLLILVAACLQYCTIADDLRRKERDCKLLESWVVRKEMFLSALEGDNIAAGIIAAAAKV
ncbi:hypothetical protein HK104_001395 [Borealophlyctis nickersoniae]|nr:hypothetical protein HK104_001395 [Borealophlyctis nickersoniae]